VFGNQAAASRTYNSGYDHHKLYISFDLYTMDSWGNLIFSMKNSLVSDLFFWYFGNYQRVRYSKFSLMVA